MKIVAYGDVVGRSGRDALLKSIPEVRALHNPDFIVVNVDNASGGWGVTQKIAEEFFANGVDVLTGGDHVWDQKEVIKFLDQEKRLLRPYNYPKSTPGKGVGLYEAKNGQRILIIHLLGQVFIKDNVNCPFTAADEILETFRLKANADAILVDFHGEATSEKNAMGVYLDGRVSAVFGSHTHVPTRDARILPKGTGYQTDLGMCGDYNGSVIGWDSAIPIQKFIRKAKVYDKMKPAEGVGEARGLVITINNSGLAESLEYI